jgi:hypothetical protein
MKRYVEPVDWPEDFKHENGNYQCQCLTCGQLFIGHKRRITCKVCSTHSKGIQQQVQADPASSQDSLT